MQIPEQLREGMFIEKKPNSKVNAQRCNHGEVIQTVVVHTYEQANTAIQRGMNVALRLSSMRIVVVDIDNAQALQYAKRKGLSSTLTEETKRGLHIYYRIPDNVLHYGSCTFKNGLELKCTDSTSSNLNVVCSPSVVDGVPYVVVNDVDIALAPVWVLEKIRRSVPATEYDSARADLSNVPHLLDSIPDCDDYHTWLSVGMILHNIYNGDNDGFELWCDWSSQSHKYDFFKTQQKWCSFDDYSGIRKGYGSLVHMARGER